MRAAIFPLRFIGLVYTSVPFMGVFEAFTPLNGVAPLVRLTDVFERMVSGQTKAHELKRLLLWTWKAEQLVAAIDA